MAGRGDSRERVIQAVCRTIREEGISEVTMRRTACEAEVALGALQFHFRSREELVRAGIRAWHRDVVETLNAAAGRELGLRRTWRLCERWSTMPDVRVIAADVLISREGAPHSPVRVALLEALYDWIERTRRTLMEAEYQSELKPDCDLMSVAIELHQLLWSQSWLAPLNGHDAAATRVRVGVWDRLAAIAVDVTELLPPRDEVAQGVIDEPPSHLPINAPTWMVVLKETDPRYQAFLRHEVLGDPRTFVHPPEVTVEDVARAEAVARRLRNQRRRNAPPRMDS